MSVPHTVGYLNADMASAALEVKEADRTKAVFLHWRNPGIRQVELDLGRTPVSALAESQDAKYAAARADKRVAVVEWPSGQVIFDRELPKASYSMDFDKIAPVLAVSEGIVDLSSREYVAVDSSFADYVRPSLPGNTSGILAALFEQVAGLRIEASVAHAFPLPTVASLESTGLPPALAGLTSFLKRVPALPEASVASAAPPSPAGLGLREWDDAVALAAKEPDDPRVLFFAMEAWERAGRSAEARTVREKMMVRFAEVERAGLLRPWDHVMRAWGYIRAGDFTAAESALEQSASDFPQSTGGYGSSLTENSRRINQLRLLALAAVPWLAGRKEDAFAAVRKEYSYFHGLLQEQRPLDGTVPTVVDSGELVQRPWLEELKAALPPVPEELKIAADPRRARDEAASLAQKGDEGKQLAAELLRKLSDTGKAEIDDLLTLARLQGELRQSEPRNRVLEKAEAEAHEAVSRNESGRYHAWTILAEVMEAKGDSGQTRQAWQKAIDAEPYRKEVCEAAGQAMLRMGDTQTACNFYHQALQQIGGRDSMEFRGVLGWMYWSLGDKDRAEDVWQEAQQIAFHPGAELVDKNVVGHLPALWLSGLAVRESDLGEPDRASLFLARALRADPRLVEPETESMRKVFLPAGVEAIQGLLAKAPKGLIASARAWLIAESSIAKAMPEIDKSLAQYPGDPHLLSVKARLHNILKQHAAAAESWHAAGAGLKETGTWREDILETARLQPGTDGSSGLERLVELAMAQPAHRNYHVIDLAWLALDADDLQKATREFQKAATMDASAKKLGWRGGSLWEKWRARYEVGLSLVSWAAKGRSAEQAFQVYQDLLKSTQGLDLGSAALENVLLNYNCGSKTRELAAALAKVAGNAPYETVVKLPAEEVADFLRAFGRNAEARQWLLSKAESDPAAAVKALLESRRHEDALQALELARKHVVASGEGEAWSAGLLLADVHHALFAWNEECDTLLDLVRSSAESTYARKDYADVLARVWPLARTLGRVPDYTAVLEKAILVWPKEIGLIDLRAQLHWNNAKLSDAASAWQMAVDGLAAEEKKYHSEKLTSRLLKFRHTASAAWQAAGDQKRSVEQLTAIIAADSEKAAEVKMLGVDLPPDLKHALGGAYKAWVAQSSESIRTALAGEKPDYDKLEHLMVVFDRIGRRTDAARACKGALEQAPDDARSRMEVNLALLLRQIDPPDLTGAEAACRRVLAVDPASADGWRELALALRESKQMEQFLTAMESRVRLPDISAEDFDQCVQQVLDAAGVPGVLRLLAAIPSELAPKFQEQAGLRLAQAGHWKEAGTVLKAVPMNDEYPLARLAKAAIEWQQGQKETARKEFFTILATGMDFLMAAPPENAGEWERVLVELRAAVKNAPPPELRARIDGETDFTKLVSLGDLMLKIDRPEEAIHAWQRVVIAGETSSWAWFSATQSLADTLLTRVSPARAGEAVAASSKIWENGKDDGSIMVQNAGLCVALGDREGAQTLCRSVIGQPDKVPAETYGQAAYVLVLAGAHDEGLAVFDKARQHYGDDPDLLNFLAWALWNAGKHEKAEAVLAKADVGTALNGKPKDLILQAGIAWSRGRKEDAVSTFSELTRQPLVMGRNGRDWLAEDAFADRLSDGLIWPKFEREALEAVRRETIAKQNK